MSVYCVECEIICDLFMIYVHVFLPMDRFHLFLCVTQIALLVPAKRRRKGQNSAAMIVLHVLQAKFPLRRVRDTTEGFSAMHP